jgi:hypothetical protein
MSAISVAQANADGFVTLFECGMAGSHALSYELFREQCILHIYDNAHIASLHGIKPLWSPRVHSLQASSSAMRGKQHFIQVLLVWEDFFGVLIRARG